ncbi:hypothetical protein FRB95_005631 [Tulasnella sp. JGI-2019a]|nr:hypothetical protein FRB95_005631 [Tulasnella sp. JGI-2019a]
MGHASAQAFLGLWIAMATILSSLCIQLKKDPVTMEPILPEAKLAGKKFSSPEPSCAISRRDHKHMPIELGKLLPRMRGLRKLTCREPISMPAVTLGNVPLTSVCIDWEIIQRVWLFTLVPFLRGAITKNNPLVDCRSSSSAHWYFATADGESFVIAPLLRSYAYLPQSRACAFYTMVACALESTLLESSGDLRPFS